MALFSLVEHAGSHPVVYGFTDARPEPGADPVARCSLSLNGAFPRAQVLANRSWLAGRVGFPPPRWVYMRQVHGAHAVWLGPGDAGRGAFDQEDALPGADALVTGSPGLVLVAQGADCLPILLHDARAGVIAAVHAGWRGTVAGVVRAALEMMCRQGGSRAEDIRAALGPCISGNVYEVGDEVVQAFEEAHLEEAVLRSPGDSRPRVDLVQANRLHLRRAGVPESAITSHEICTYGQHPDFFSARRGDAGRQVGFIALRDL